ncbi:hypothetical protein TNCV_4367731 [Trichonephila clavipes]|nr:hypothetical protein TNCV_4367731 [Trichonephila clavipes]
MSPITIKSQNIFRVLLERFTLPDGSESFFCQWKFEFLNTRLFNYSSRGRSKLRIRSQNSLEMSQREEMTGDKCFRRSNSSSAELFPSHLRNKSAAIFKSDCCQTGKKNVKERSRDGRGRPLNRRVTGPWVDCQVIYSQFGLAIHQNDHQARRRFVEWAQNEIAGVPNFHKRILFSDEEHFWLNGYVNKQNCRIWSEANPQVYVETPLHPEKLTVWCALWAGGILLQKR